MSIPANIEIYVSEFRKLIRFEILKPDNMIGLVKPGYTLALLIGDAKTSVSASLDSSGVESSSFMVNMGVYIFAGGAFLLAMLVLVLLMMLRRLKEKIKGIIEKVMKKTFWNNTIRSITISYLETTISLHV